MSKKIETVGEVLKITRTSGKEFAQVSIQVPASKAGDIPMGAVNITLEPNQSSIDDFLPAPKPASKKKVRGDRG